MKKKILCLTMAAFMAVGSPLLASAEEFQGSDDWTVSFDGEAMSSNFNSSDITEDILQILPGDSITVQVNLKNASEGKTDWYMTNEVLQSLEDSQASAAGGAYTYILSYFNANGEETILYSSAVVGGEGSTGGEGLHQATSTLEDYFYLERLEEGKSGRVRLYVQLDGETQGNSYQDTLAKIMMNFAVEKVNDGKIVQITTAVPTGDTTPIMMFSLVALISGLVLLVLATKAMKDRKKGE